MDVRADRSLRDSERFYYRQIDGLRCLAFFMVFCGHFYDVTRFFPAGSVWVALLWPFNKRGWTGVDVFLVLSSFLIFSLLLAERDRHGKVSIGRFYIRRALRIWPLYFPYLLFAMLIVPLAWPQPSPYWLTIKQHLFPFLTFFGNISYAYFLGSLSQLFAHLWTVCLEEQFYVFPPVVVMFAAFRLDRRLLVPAAILLAFSFGCKVYVIANGVAYPMLWSNPFCRMDPFIAGALCAAIVHERPAWMERQVGLWFLLAAILGFALVCLGPQLGTSMNGAWQLPVVTLSAACLVMSALTNGGPGSVFASRPLAFLGKISFGLYVYHEICLQAVLAGLNTKRFLGETPLSYSLDFTLALGATIAVASISYLYYERPILLFKQRFELIRSRPA
jgi:peptidoglycan/LPS O-acetylase OafA/YrhL